MSIYFCVVTYLKHLTQQQLSLATNKYTILLKINQVKFICISVGTYMNMTTYDTPPFALQGH